MCDEKKLGFADGCPPAPAHKLGAQCAHSDIKDNDSPAPLKLHVRGGTAEASCGTSIHLNCDIIYGRAKIRRFKSAHSWVGRALLHLARPS